MPPLAPSSRSRRGRGVEEDLRPDYLASANRFTQTPAGVTSFAK